MINLKEYITTTEALEFLSNKVTLTTLHRWCKESKLEHIRLSSRLLIKKSSLEAFVLNK